MKLVVNIQEQVIGIPGHFRTNFTEYHSNMFRFTGCRWFKREEILHFSKNKADLELIISAKKYNL